ncbi:heparinase II/III family protein [Paenibacillus sp. CC-CFT747]|nr:heparinase II/III family protein [Paenibacillus sp. CC-CFT747]
MVRYAGQFPHYPVHPDAQPWMLKGRAFHQALTEAVWATSLLRAYGLLQEEGVSFEDDAPVLDRFFSLLEESMVQYRRILIEEKRNPENNYTAWLNAALSCIYAIRGDRKKLDALVEGEGGILHHLSIGVKADGFEFEGATYYHVFVLRAYLIAAEMAEKLGRNLYEAAGSEGQSFRFMLEVLIGLADDQGDLPALHDGPYRRVPYSREIAEVMEIGLARYGMTSCGSVLGAVYQDLYGTRRQRGLEALLFGTGAVDLSAPPDAAREGLLLKESGFAVLRYPGSPISVLADFGPHGGSHGHYDKLHISLSHAKGKLTPELGMVPYGSALRREWYAETASHNTVSVNGASQAPHTGDCVRYEQREDGTYLHIRSKDAYPGCVMDRHLLLTSHWMLDWFEITLEEASTVDWHCYGAAGFQPVNRDGREDGPAEDPAQLLVGMLGNPHVQPAGRVGGGASAASGGKWQSFRIPVASSGDKGTAGRSPWPRLCSRIRSCLP